MLALPIDLATNVRSVLGDGHIPAQSHLATSNFSVSSIVKSLRHTASFYSTDSRDFDEMVHQFHDDLDWDEPEYQAPRQYDIWHEVLKYFAGDASTLAKLCLVDREMHHIASPFLWHTVNLRTKPRRYQRFHRAVQAMSDPSKPYGKYVRKVRISSPITSKFGSRELPSDLNFDLYYRDVCQRFRRNICAMLPLLSNLESFEWSTTLHIDQEVMLTLAAHPSIKSVDICPGCNQGFMSPLRPGSVSPVDSIGTKSLRSLTLTVPSMLNGAWLECAAGSYTESLIHLLKNSPELKSLSLRLAMPRQRYGNFGALEISALPQSKVMDFVLFTNIYKLARERPNFHFQLSGITTEDLWTFLQRHPLTSIKKLTFKEHPSDGNFLGSYCTPQDKKRSSWVNYFMPSKDTCYDYSFVSPDTLTLRDDGHLQERILEMYGDNLEELDIIRPNVAIHHVALCNLRKLRTGVCIANGKEWIPSDLDTIAERCPRLEHLELAIYKKWAYWKICKYNHLEYYNEFLKGYGKLKRLDIGVGSSGPPGSPGVACNLLLSGQSLQGTSDSKHIPMDQFVQYLLETYPALTALSLRSKAAIDFSHGVRADAERLQCAIDTFKTG